MRAAASVEEVGKASSRSPASPSSKLLKMLASLLPRVYAEDGNLNMTSINPAIKAFGKFYEENPVELTSFDPSEDPNVVIENYKDTKVIRAEGKGTVMKAEGRFLSNES